jgi:hypothetical protein
MSSQSAAEPARSDRGAGIADQYVVKLTTVLISPAATSNARDRIDRHTQHLNEPAARHRQGAPSRSAFSDQTRGTVR